MGQDNRVNCFAVGAYQGAESVTDVWQRSSVLAVGEQFICSDRAAGEHDPARGDRAPFPADPSLGPGRHPVAIATV